MFSYFDYHLSVVVVVGQIVGGNPGYCKRIRCLFLSICRLHLWLNRKSNQSDIFLAGRRDDLFTSSLSQKTMTCFLIRTQLCYKDEIIEQDLVVIHHSEKSIWRGRVFYWFFVSFSKRKSIVTTCKVAPYSINRYCCWRLLYSFRPHGLWFR